MCGDVRGETRGLVDAWRDSLDASVAGGDRGDRGGEGASDESCFGSWPFALITLGVFSSEDLGDPYCNSC